MDLATIRLDSGWSVGRYYPVHAGLQRVVGLLRGASLIIKEGMGFVALLRGGLECIKSEVHWSWWVPLQVAVYTSFCRVGWRLLTGTPKRVVR